MNGGVQIVRIVDDLPERFEALRLSAEAEQMVHLTRLADDWAVGSGRFTSPGACLFAAFVEGALAGVGGVTREPSSVLAHARRMRRFYVAPQMRGRGVGRALASAAMQEALAVTPTLTVHTARSDGEAFWLAMGFRPDLQNGWTHRYGV
jgi:GNAT superfamily N-acetyltransferase